MLKVEDEKLVQEFIQNAIEIAKKLEINLDFTNESVARVEEILAQIYEENKKTPIDPKKIENLGYAFGCYAGETLIKNLKMGSWETESVNNALGVKINFEYIFFPSKAIKRITEGGADNIYHLYMIVLNDYQNPSKDGQKSSLLEKFRSLFNNFINKMKGAKGR